ncbi:MAG: hypothetical protein QM780_06330 [Hyphomicrobium sp.]|uniref:hypothetical protein n=1 Tax=Hyphomicrobium sp. TaxID=82 RepID=UPI0039E42B3A
MDYRSSLIVTCTAFLVIGSAAAHAGQTIKEDGIIVCATDKWDEKEVEKGHKLVDATSRCVLLSDADKTYKVSEACAAKYEYLPDGSWKGNGTCTDTHPGGDKVFLTYTEGSDLKEYTFQKTGGTGKYQGASGGGTYMYEGLTDTLFAGRYKGTIVLP